MDLVVYGIILTLFAVFATVHLILCAKLTRRSWWQGLVGFVAFPLAPYWGQAWRIRGLPTMWVITGSLYALALIVGFI